MDVQVIQLLETEVADSGGPPAGGASLPLSTHLNTHLYSIE